jgi:hypothetical protein
MLDAYALRLRLCWGFNGGQCIFYSTSTTVGDAMLLVATLNFLFFSPVALYCLDVLITFVATIPSHAFILTWTSFVKIKYIPVFVVDDVAHCARTYRE